MITLVAVICTCQGFKPKMAGMVSDSVSPSGGSQIYKAEDENAKLFS